MELTKKQKAARDRVPGALTRQLENLFPASVAISVATDAMYSAPLFEQELSTLKCAVEKRKREFSAGRAAAREALLTLGVSKRAIPVNADRSPHWPAGFVGSITHCRGFCGAVAANNAQVIGIGFDAEVSTDLTSDILKRVCSASENENVPHRVPARGIEWAAIAFCAKEAFYKCQYPIARRILDFDEVSVRFESHGESQCGNFAVFLSQLKSDERDRSILGRWCVHKGIIFAGATFLRTECPLVTDAVVE